MKKAQKDPGQMFDSLVGALNKWLADVESPKKNLIMRLFPSLVHPLWRRYDLTGAQIDAVSLASDYERVLGELERIAGGSESAAYKSADEARKDLALARNMVDMYRKTYVAEAEMRKNRNP